MRYILFAASSFALLAAVPQSSAQNLFEDNFDDMIGSARWQSFSSVSVSPADTFVDYAFDYGLGLGIPAAPHSNGTTIGMSFTVNRNGENTTTLPQGISASPFDQHFTGDFTIEFDAWLNFVGPFPLGGSGSTQMASFGWGTTGTRVQTSASNHSVLFAASSDGNTTQDYRVYRVGGGAPLAPDTSPGVYAAGNVVSPAASDSRQASDPYYASLGSKTAPAAQLALFPGQTGTTAPGTFGMAWHDVTIDKVGDTLTWTVDGLRIATVPLNGAVPGGDNLFFGMFDINTTPSGDPNDFLNNAIFDNIVVKPVPEPSMTGLLACAGGVALMRRRKG
jgi:hypothetical protein